MGLNNIKESNVAVVGIVTAVLLLGLFISIIALIQTVYVPNWMEQKEAEHMEIVRDQFSQLKFAIDINSAIEQEYTPIATTITLGSKELPFFMSQRSYGALEIISDEFNVNITNITSSNSNFYSNYDIGSIKYSSDNAYFIDQSFIYESGAVITSQSDGDSISVKPVFITENISDEIVIHFTLINISGVGNKTAYGGYDSIAIQTEYCNCTKNKDIEIPNTKYINITTSYANSWSNYINSSLKKVLDYYENNQGDYEIIPINDGLSIYFYNTIKIDLKFITIYAQIGPGWVE
jgi:hypothetical protein